MPVPGVATSRDATWNDNARWSARKHHQLRRRGYRDSDGGVLRRRWWRQILARASTARSPAPPQPDMTQRWPDAMAATPDSRIQPVLAAGTRSNSVVAVQGTRGRHPDRPAVDGIWPPAAGRRARAGVGTGDRGLSSRTPPQPPRTRGEGRSRRLRWSGGTDEA